MAREQFARKLKSLQQPYASSWFEIDKLYDSWAKQCYILCNNLQLCPKCAAISFTYTESKLNVTDNHDYTQGHLASMLLLERMNSSNIKSSWNLCSTCRKNDSRVPYVVVLAPDYIQWLLGAEKLHTQLLSIIDISVSVTKTTHAIAQGLLERRSLLDNPLICWSTFNNKKTTAEVFVSSSISDILAFNIENNPVLQKYKAMAERKSRRLGLCVLSEEVLDNILHNHNDTRPFDIMTEVESANTCSILQTLAEP